MPKESDHARIINHLDTAVCIAIESHAIYSADDLAALINRLWSERSTERASHDE